MDNSKVHFQQKMPKFCECKWKTVHKLIVTSLYKPMQSVIIQFTCSYESKNRKVSIAIYYHWRALNLKIKWFEYLRKTTEFWI